MSSPAPAPAPAAPAAPPAPQQCELTSAFLPPASIIKAVEAAGTAKGNLPIVRAFLLAVMAGIFIAIGACCSISFAKGMDSADPGVQKFAFGAVFPVGLVLVIIAGSELATGNFAVLVPAFLNHKIKWYQLLINWITVYSGNFIGSLAVAYFWAYLPELFAKDPWLKNVQGIAEAKTASSFGVMFLSGTGCNFLVCLAVFMAIAAKTLICKVAVIWFPIQTFVTIGFEHCVANMFFVPNGILYGANVSFGQFIAKNLVPVTLGNMFSAIVFVAMVYWYLYNLPPGWPCDQKPVGLLAPSTSPASAAGEDKGKKGKKGEIEMV